MVQESDFLSDIDIAQRLTIERFASFDVPDYDCALIIDSSHTGQVLFIVAETETLDHDFVELETMNDALLLEVPNNHICLEPHVSLLPTSNVSSRRTDC